VKALHQILVLNRVFIPIHIIDWTKCMTLLVKGHARPLDQDLVTYTFEEWIEYSATEFFKNYQKISTSRRQIAVPEIIVLQHYDHLPKYEVKYTRQSLFELYDFRCAYCGKVFTKNRLEVEHILPVSKGGRSSWKNTVPACRSCNSRKSNRTPEEAGMRILYPLKKPGWISPLQKIRRGGTCASWNRFMDTSLVDMGDTVPEE
jgi:5-methylcytosine-specific restriction endonuclease McrA